MTRVMDFVATVLFFAAGAALGRGAIEREAEPLFIALALMGWGLALVFASDLLEDAR